MIFLILSWKDRRTPRCLLDVVGSHEHNSQKCMNCWFVLTFQQRSVWSEDDCHMSKGFYGKNSTQKNIKKKPRCSTVSTFSFFQEILLFLPFKINRVNHQVALKPSDMRRNLICIEPYCGKSAGLKCDRSKSMEVPWIEKQDLFLSWKNQFCFGTYVHAKQIFQLYMNLYQCVYICTSKQLVSSLCVDQILFLNAFVLEWFLNVFCLVASNGIFFNAVCSSVHFDIFWPKKHSWWMLLFLRWCHLRVHVSIHQATFLNAQTTSGFK